jgi:hypothetical protein
MLSNMQRAIFFVALAALFGSTVVAQNGVTIISDPNDLSRPISTILAQLRKREKISLTYEDPCYANVADIQDVTPQVARNISPSEMERRPRILVPKGRAVTFVYIPQDMRSPDDAMATIERLLREYEALGGPTFTVTRDGVRFHVVPSEVLNAKGERISQDSILDTVISIPPGRRDGGEFLQAICDQVQKQTGYAIGVGPSVPGNNLARYRTNEGIENESARTAMEQLLDKATLPGSFVWDLYYGPDVKSYGLNFNYVGTAGPMAK